MGTAKLFVIDYILHGTPKSFIIRSENMDDAEAGYLVLLVAPPGRPPRRADFRKSTRAH